MPVSKTSTVKNSPSPSKSSKPPRNTSPKSRAATKTPRLQSDGSSSTSSTCPTPIQSPKESMSKGSPPPSPASEVGLAVVESPLKMQPLLQKNQRKLPAPTNRDRIVWTLHKSGIGDDEVCQRLRMSADELALSKLRMLSYTQSINNDVLALANNEALLSVSRSGHVEGALNGALQAERMLVTRGGGVVAPLTQQPITEPDHSTRLEAVRTFSRLVKDNRPSGPMVAINTAINNSNTQNNLIAGRRSFETRRRAAAERRGAVTGTAVAESEAEDDEVIDAEFDDPDFAEDSPNEDDGE